jgi:Skp family chaperone for outer membrane proteins
MRDDSLKAILLGLVAVSALAGPAAQAAPPTAPAPPPAVVAPPPAVPAPAVAPTNPRGPLVPGVCLLSQEMLIGQSKIGQAATARLRDLAQQAQANLVAEKARLEARGKALEARRATLTPLQLQAQGQALNQRAQALQAEAGERSQQIDATKTRAYNLVLKQAEPFIAEAYAAHACGLLFARETVLTGNLGNDLTAEVLASLDAKATPVTFDLDPPHPAK